MRLPIVLRDPSVSQKIGGIMRIFGVIGWKNSGKTHLMVRLVSEITSRGYSVSTIKHAHHALTFSTCDEDGEEQRPAGAHEAIFSSPTRWSLTKEVPPAADEDPLSELVQRLESVDLVLVEGYKLEGHPKLEAHRAGSKRDLIAREDDRIVAIASDAMPSGVTVPVFDLDDTIGIADFIVEFVGLAKQTDENAASL